MAVVASLAAALPVRAQLPDQTDGLSDTVIIGGQVFNFPEATNISQLALNFLPAGGLPNGAVLLYETATDTNVSDQLWVQQGFFNFASDPDLVDLELRGILVVMTLVEDGTLQDVSGAWGLPPGSVQVQSDVIPEPSAFMLVCVGLLGLPVLARRRRHGTAS